MAAVIAGEVQLTNSNLREVILYPTRQWGGDGLIGCGIGYGLLHRIPRPPTPPETVFAADGYFAEEVQPPNSGGTGLPGVEPVLSPSQVELRVPTHPADA